MRYIFSLYRQIGLTVTNVTDFSWFMSHNFFFFFAECEVLFDPAFYAYSKTYKTMQTGSPFAVLGGPCFLRTTQHQDFGAGYEKVNHVKTQQHANATQEG